MEFNSKPNTEKHDLMEVNSVGTITDGVSVRRYTSPRRVRTDDVTSTRTMDEEGTK